MAGRKRACLALTAVLLVSVGLRVRAEVSRGGSDWQVSFTDSNKMVSNFKTSDINDTIYGMQPGDQAVIELDLKNDNSETTDWYMTNKVLYSLEDRTSNRNTGGGAYSYRLSYTDRKGTETVLFDSDTVGGDMPSGRREGLREATEALEDYFYLDTLKPRESGNVVLQVALEGETQGNDYQSTLADLQMNFAVELSRNDDPDPLGGESPGRRTSSLVRTGDETDLTPFITASCISGILLLILSVQGLFRKKKEGGQHEAS